MLFCGGMDTTVPCSTIMSAYNGITNQPVMLAEYLAADHANWISFSGTTVKPVEATVTAWMRVHLMGDTALRARFYGRVVHALPGHRLDRHAQDDGSVAGSSARARLDGDAAARAKFIAHIECVLYQLHEYNRALLAPAVELARAGAYMFSAPGELAVAASRRGRVAAGYELLYRLGKDYEKPACGIHEVNVGDLDGARSRCVEQIGAREAVLPAAALQARERRRRSSPS